MATPAVVLVMQSHALSWAWCPEHGICWPQALRPACICLYVSCPSPSLPRRKAATLNSHWISSLLWMSLSPSQPRGGAHNFNPLCARGRGDIQGYKTSYVHSVLGGKAAPAQCVQAQGELGSGAQAGGVGVRLAGGAVHVRTCGKGLGRRPKHCWGHLQGFKQPGWALTSGSSQVPPL